MSTSLPREILKWLQSLDLSYSVKNARRDFSNGFLIAEIFSRYFQYDISLHSYDNGSSLQIRIDNWALMGKFFKKRNINIPTNLINGCIHQKDGMAQKLVEHVYSLLTSRNVDVLKPVEATNAPGYSKPTATSLIANNIKDSEAKSTELLATQGKAAAIVEDHDAAIKKEKREKRAAGEDTLSRQHARVQTRQLGGEAEGAAPAIQFDAVKVKNVERSVSELRQSMAPGKVPGSDSVAQGMRAAEPIRSVNSILGSGLLVALQHNGGAESVGLSGVGPDDLWPTFIAQLESSSSDTLTAVFDELSTKAMQQVVVSCLRSPKEFWQLVSLLLPASHRLHTQARGSAVLQFFTNFAHSMVASDPDTTWNLFVDFGLTKLCALLKKDASGSGVSQLLTIVYAFCADSISAHISAIKALQDNLNDQASFMLALAGLISLENSFDDDLLDLYLYYCVVGLGMPSPKLQAAALSMLPTCAQQQPALVLSKMSLISTLARSHWWEVHAQLVVVAATLLEYVEPEETAEPLDLLQKLLSNPSQRRNDVLKVAACALAPCMSEDDGMPTQTCPNFPSLYTDLLVALPVETVRALMDVRNNPCLSVPGSSTVVPLALTSPPLLWSASQVSRALLERGELSLQACEVLLTVGAQLESAEQTGMVLQSAQLLFGALGDQTLCAMASTVLQTLIQNTNASYVKEILESLVKAVAGSSNPDTGLLHVVSTVHDGAVTEDLKRVVMAEAPQLMEIPEIQEFL